MGFFNEVRTLAITIILFSALIISFITDIRKRLILNIVTFPAILLGLVLNTVQSGWEGLLFSFLGLLLGFGLLIIPYALGGIAAGDVKLLAAIGALQGSSFVFSSFIYTSIIGSLIAVLFLLKRKELSLSLKRIFISAKLKTLDSLDKTEMNQTLPYGVAIALGTFLHMGVSLL